MIPHQCVYILIESFSFDFHISYFWSNTTQIFEKRCHELFIYFWQISIWLWHHTLLHIFLVKLVFEASLFQLFLFLEIDIWRSLLKKKKFEKIYKHKSTYVSRSSKTIYQSFMTSLKIYLQKSNVNFYMLLTLKKCIYITS